MTQAASVHHQQELTFPIKLLSYAVWIGAGALFWRLGGFGAISDPEAPISLFGGASALTLPLALGLAILTAVTATLVLDRWIAEAGTFAVSVGLAALSVRGGTVEYLLIRAADSTGARGAGLALEFALELLVWVVVLYTGIAASAWVGTRLASRTTGRGRSAPRFAAEDCTVLNRILFNERAVTPTSRRDGILHAGVVALIALTVIVVFSLDMKERPVTHGQVLFVNAAAGWIAVYFAFRRFPVASPMWSITAMFIVPLVGYLIAAMTSGKFDLPANLPHSPFLRALPVQAAAAGAAGAIWGFWIASASARMHAGRPTAESSEHPRVKR